MTAEPEYVDGFRDLGLSEGDTVLIHSSLISFNWREYGGIEELATVIFDSLYEVLGEEGTIIVPTFSFSFTDDSPNGYWNFVESESEMGVFTEYVRSHPESTRTVHPFYSFAIFGDLSDELGRIHARDSFSTDYLFGNIHQMNAQILILGLDYNSAMTFFHYVEQQEGVDYRHKKDFHGIMNIHGKEYYDTYSMLVRDLDRGIETYVNPMGERLEDEGVFETKSIGGAEVKLGRAKNIYEATAQNMKENEKLLYKENKD